MAQSIDPILDHMGGLASDAMPHPYEGEFRHDSSDDDDDYNDESNDELASDTMSHPYETESSQDDTFSDLSYEFMPRPLWQQEPPHFDMRELNSLFANGTAVGRYAPSIASSDVTGTGLEDERRLRLQPSVCGESSAASSASYSEAVFSVRRGERRPYQDSVFSSLHDGKTRASRTTSQSLAQQAMNAALLPAVDELPEVVTFEPMAPGSIGQLGQHWNHVGVAPTTVGPQASSATAMAAHAAATSTASSNGRPTPQSTASRSTDATEVVAELPCEFRKYKNCTVTFPLHRSAAGIDPWTDHMVRTHLVHRFPNQTSRCWFCETDFPIRKEHQSSDRVAMDVYLTRMRHIAQHYLKQARDEEAPATPRPDPDFEAHLVKNGIWEPPAVQGVQSRVPSGNDVREPIQDRTKSTKRIRSARREAQYITERRRHGGSGRPQIHQVMHYQ